MVASSCAELNVNSLPQPGKSFAGGYDLVIEFDNVLNLPDHAKVVMNGTEVGVTTKVALASRQANVTARIGPGIVVPSNVHATLQQATVLGDIFVTLERPQDGAAAPALVPGATIPLAQTTSPPQLEDTIAHLANFVTTGSIQRIQNTIVGINRVTPPPDGLSKMAYQVAADMSDLSNNIDTVDQMLNGVSGTAAVLHDRLASAQYWVSPRGMRGFERTTAHAAYLAYLFPSIGIVYTGGYWLVPLLNSVANALGAMRQSKFAFEDEAPAWRRLTTDFFLPQDKYPAINITSIMGPDGRELSGNVADVLRILGAAP
ncbi:mammalian cell entry protein [Mycobacterium colombiense]|uniref:Mammalian cell entry protein n=1 Tax=Mycobacterium colombiense TaxID=339268 RepID=A0A1A2RKZ1_9MYCO|nr:mammalian cell entry protein [Mycobacterium colombiense]